MSCLFANCPQRPVQACGEAPIRLPLCGSALACVVGCGHRSNTRPVVSLPAVGRASLLSRCGVPWRMESAQPLSRVRALRMLSRLLCWLKLMSRRGRGREGEVVDAQFSIHLRVAKMPSEKQTMSRITCHLRRPVQSNLFALRALG